MNDSVVITGIGLISPLGDKLADFLDNIYLHNCGISEITLFNTENYQCKLAGEIGNFNAEQYLGKKGLRNMDRSTKLILTASQLAVNDSGYPLKGELDEEIGVVAGNTFGSLKSMSEYDRISILESPSDVSPINFANCVINSAAGYVSIRFKAMCVNVTMSNGISSFADSLAYAYDFINKGRAKMLLVGGVEEFCEETFYGFLKSGLLALKSDINELRGPFDKFSKGIILGEGSAMLTLEPLKSAQKRGANIYAEVAGYGRDFKNGKNPVKSMTRCMEKTIKNAGLDISDIDVIIASANGYTPGDRSEVKAIEKVFETYPGTVSVTSIKGSTGECYSASGAFQMAAAIGVLKRNEVPGVVKCEDCIPANSKLEIVRRNIKKPVFAVLLNSFDFSGSNTCIVLKRFEPYTLRDSSADTCHACVPSGSKCFEERKPS